MTVCAVIVTYNRIALLERCINAMLEQTVQPDRILVVDNASTDDTSARVKALAHTHKRLTYHRLDTNSGGAGGFSEGIRVSSQSGFDWCWVMDDDARPHDSALEELMKEASDPDHIYGSLAVSGIHVSWPMTLMAQPEPPIELAADMPSKASVRFVPFLGLMVHRKLVDRIGLPEAGFFIAADDVEYCMRAKLAGSTIYAVGGSRIEHPQADLYYLNLPGYRLSCLRIAPWKRYYDTRNRLLIARKYYGMKLYTQTIPGSFLRMYACILNEPNRMKQLRAFAAGMIDGLRGIQGQRHQHWRIAP